MAINDGFYWYKNVLKKQLKLALRIYLSIAIVLSPIFLMNAANAAVGGWSMSNPVAQGASVVYNGAKNVLINGKNVAKTSTALITPVATDVAKVLGKGVAGVALSVAVEQLIGAGVEWVLDPANNRVKYYPDNSQPGQYLFGINDIELASSPSSACALSSKRTESQWIGKLRLDSTKGTHGSCVSDAYPGGFMIYRRLNPTYDPTAEKEEKYIPLPTVAQQVISNAESGDTDAQVATTAAAADIVNDAQNDSTKARPIVNQLEANAETKTEEEATGTQTQNPTKPEVTDLKLEFPTFCGWAPLVCEAAQTVISFPQTLTDWWNTGKSKAEEWATSISEAWTAAKEWATSEPQEEDSNELEFEDLNIDADQVNLSGSNNCPQDSVSFSVMGKSVTLDMPYQPVCDALNFFKPAVLLVGAVASVYIVAGVRTKEEDHI